MSPFETSLRQNIQSQYSLNQEESVHGFRVTKIATLILVYHIFCNNMALE